MLTNPKKQTIVEIALKGCELWRDSDGNGHATVKGGNCENYVLNSDRFKQWLSGEVYRGIKSAVRREQLDETVRVLEHEAKGARVYKVGIRVCGHNGKVYLDLCDEARQVIEIDAAGWRIVAPSPVKFLRKPAMSALPAPETGGNLNSFLRVLNVPPGDAQILLIGFMVGAFLPNGPYIILVFCGEQGTGKTTAAKAVKFIIDPSERAALRSRPKDENQLLLWAQGCWVLALDNVSFLPQWMSDALCRLSTGGGHSVRKLYTDGEEFFLDAQRPVILTGIEDIVNRGDLIDRAIIIQLPQITDEARISEAEVWTILERERPRILGALLDAVSCALRNRDSVKLPSKPRMADFAEFMSAAEESVGWTKGTFLNAYLSNRREAFEIGLDSSEFFKVLCRAIEPGATFNGTPTELHAKMRTGVNYSDDDSRSLPKNASRTGVNYSDDDSRSLPKNASRTSGELRKIAPALRQIGWTVNFSRGHQRMIEIVRAGEVTDSAVAGDEPTNDPLDGLP